MSEKKEHLTMIGEALDRSNGWSRKDRIYGALLGLFIDPITILGEGLRKIGIDTSGELNEWDFKNP